MTHFLTLTAAGAAHVVHTLASAWLALRACLLLAVVGILLLALGSCAAVGWGVARMTAGVAAGSPNAVADLAEVRHAAVW